MARTASTTKKTATAKTTEETAVVETKPVEEAGPKKAESVEDVRAEYEKKFAELLDGLVERPQGKPVLVPMDDKRTEMNIAKADFANQ